MGYEISDCENDYEELLNSDNNENHGAEVQSQFSFDQKIEVSSVLHSSNYESVSRVFRVT